MSLEDTRALIANRIQYLPASGMTIRFEQDGTHYAASVAATTTAVSCPAYTALPVGLRFTLDNSNGSGSLTLTPTTGTAIVVTTGKVYDCFVAANGSIKAGELAAAPT
jgi:hypothetical protein